MHLNRTQKSLIDGNSTILIFALELDWSVLSRM